MEPRESEKEKNINYTNHDIRYGLSIYLCDVAFSPRHAGATTPRNQNPYKAIWLQASGPDFRGTD